MKYILSLDSGGIRGIAGAQFLLRLDAFLQNETKLNIYQTFDMFIGSSIGGLLALGLGSNINLKTCDEIFSLKNMKIVLGQNNYTSYLASSIIPKCGSVGLNQIINKYIPDLKLNQLNKKVLIISYNLDEQKTVIYKESNINIRKLAQLTTAAPAYFPCVKCPDGKWHIDGGIAISNPALTAYIEGTLLYKDNFKILSIGTGYTNINIDGYKAQRWGFLRWMWNDLGYMLRNIPFMVVSEQCSQLLQDNFLRINSEIKHISLDDTSTKTFNKLKKLGDTWFDDNLHKIRNFFDIRSKSKL